MYGKPATTRFIYQVYLYGSEAITYLNAPTLHYKGPSPLCMAAKPSPNWKRTLVRLNQHTYVKRQRENLFG